MKVVFDTNVVVSAALKDRDPEEVIDFVIEQPTYQWVASDEIVDEYLRVLRRPKLAIPATELQEWFDLFAQHTRRVQPEYEGVAMPRDPKDAKFLACAKAARADYLVTGDRDFESAESPGDTLILSVSEFKALVSN